MSHIAGKIKKWIRCSAHTKFEPAPINTDNDVVKDPGPVTGDTAWEPPVDPLKVTHPAWPDADSEAPQPVVTGDSPALRNFKFLRATLGDDAAFDYLVKHVPGGGNMVRDMFADRNESARVVNKYGVGAQRGRVEGDEYVYGPAFTEGKRVKLPG